MQHNHHLTLCFLKRLPDIRKALCLFEWILDNAIISQYLGVVCRDPQEPNYKACILKRIYSKNTLANACECSSKTVTYPNAKNKCITIHLMDHLCESNCILVHCCIAGNEHLCVLTSHKIKLSLLLTIDCGNESYKILIMVYACAA